MLEIVVLLFSLVVKSSTVWLLLSTATSHNWIVHQLNLKNAFLHGLLDEEVYIRKPPSFVYPLFLSYVYSLKKSIYELKQAPHVWFHRFIIFFILSKCFIYNKVDTSTFI